MYGLSMLTAVASSIGTASAQTPSKKNNILIIWGDDIGQFNISAYNPKDSAFKAMFGPRGVLHCFASDTDDPTVDPRFGKVGRQTIEDTGPLLSKFQI
jgi:hypothetical protein